jgi:hypothetical protein
MSTRYQNNPHAKGKFPSYYANNKIYPGAYAPTDVPGRTSRRIHDGFDLTRNYGLDTTSDDINSSPYSSPYYINGRYLADNLVFQRGNSSSVQGIKMLLFPEEFKRSEDFAKEDIQTTLEMWQGKQIKFELPYNGKVVGNTITLRNTGGSTGILSIYFSTKEGGVPIYETAIDLCTVSQDIFEHRELYSITTIPATANPRKKLYVRMEIWDEVERCEGKRNANPFNTGRKIEIAATGKGAHEACVYKLQEKNEPVREQYDYKHYPSQPLIGLIYSDWESVPVDRLDNVKTGATVSLRGYRYDIMCVKKNGEANVIIYDKEMNKLVLVEDPNTHELGLPPIKVDGRIEQLNIAQVTDTDKVTWVYYVDGYSPLQRFKIGEWISSAFPDGSADNVQAQIDEDTWYNSPLGSTGGTYIFTYHNGNWEYNSSPVSLATYGISLIGGGPSEDSTITVLYTVTTGGTKTIESIQFVDARPVLGAKLIMFHNNRLFLAGFRNDPNLVQVSAIEAEGPSFTKFPYRFYTPNRSPYDTSLNPITAMVEHSTDRIMITMRNGYSIYSTYSGAKSTGLEDYMPTQVSTFMDSAGVQSQGDVCNYKGVIYSYDEKEGLRRYNGSMWNDVPAAQPVSSHFDRVDMSKPRKLWGFSNKLYYNYYDRVDGKAKCLIWDQQMNYQSYPMFMDQDIPFCDVRSDESEDLIGIHADYPAIMLHYAEDTWRRFDTPITFERWTKYLSLPGNAADIIINRVHAKVLANATRWWWIGITGDKQSFIQERGRDIVYREPVWRNKIVEEAPETAFPSQDIYGEDATYRLSIMDLRLQRESIQVKVKTKTMRDQASLMSVLVEVQPKQYL